MTSDERYAAAAADKQAYDIANGTKGTCPVCNTVRGVQNPKGGDGSIRVMRFHLPAEGGAFRVVHQRKRCAGVNQPAKEWS